jgi:hypothetical protein
VIVMINGTRYLLRGEPIEIVEDVIDGKRRG